MKTMVIYKSATGFTRKYAAWIAEELAADLFAATEVTAPKMAEYDCIIFGGRLYAAGIDGLPLITKNFGSLRDKHLIVFATGASLASEAVLSEVRSKNLNAEQQTSVQLFYLRGGFDYATLPRFDKILMTLLKRMIMRKKRKGKPLTPDEAGILRLYDEVTDFTKKEHIQEIIEAARLNT